MGVEKNFMGDIFEENTREIKEVNLIKLELPFQTICVLESKFEFYLNKETKTFVEKVDVKQFEEILGNRILP